MTNAGTLLAMARGQLEFHGTDRFEIRRLLGSGGMGIVYEAVDRDRDAAIALKTLRYLNADALYRLKRSFYVPE